MRSPRLYIPALNWQWLTPLYDPLLQWLFHELVLKQRSPHSRVMGVDIDARILAIARGKTLRAQVDLHFARGSAAELPYADGGFDRVLYHLTTVQKQRALDEACRVLRPGGEAHIVDFGTPHTPVARAIALVARHFEAVSDNVRGTLPVMLRRAGFAQVEARRHRMTLLGTLTFISARKPESSHAPVAYHPLSERSGRDGEVRNCIVVRNAFGVDDVMYTCKGRSICSEFWSSMMTRP